MLTIQKEYSKIKDSKEFKEFKDKNSDSFLSSIFIDEKGFQFNFFNNDKLITFYFENNGIKTEESDIYEENKDMKELKLTEVKFNLEKAKELVNKITEDKHESVNKKIIILQQKDSPFWNMTYITDSMNILNIKIDAISGKIIEQSFENIMNLNANKDQ